MSDTTRRCAALVALVILAAGAVALSRSEPSHPAGATAPRQPIDGPTVPSGRAVSAAWYCAEGTSTVDGRATETVIIGNLEPRSVDIAITVMPGGDEETRVQQFRLDPYEQRRVPIADLIRTAEPGVVVEVFGGQAVVEHEVEGRDDVAVGPCSRAAARTWYFAEGSTERGAEDWLALFNPFGEDAIVDLGFLTDAGLQAPESAQALVVPRRSRISVAVHDLARRQAQVATVVRARTGRIVAERTQLFDGTDTRRGVALSLGSTGTADEWRFAVGDSQDGSAQSVSIANFTNRSARVEVQVELAGDASLSPETVEVTSNAVVRVDVGGKVTGRGGYGVDVRSVNDVRIAVGAFAALAPPAPVTGVATTPGSAGTAPRWSFAVGRLGDDGEAVISARNVSTRPLTVQLYAYTAGDPNSPASAPAEAVSPGERVTFSLTERGIRPDQVIVVAADGPIVVGREIVGPGASIAPGVPFDAARR